MSGADLSYAQILEAARQLPAHQKKNLIHELVEPPARVKALGVARRLRAGFRLNATKQKKLSDLLQKGNAGELTQTQRLELDGLIDEVLEKREQLAEAVAKELANRTEPKSRKSDTTLNGSFTARLSRAAAKSHSKGAKSV
jgi:hypothetical protein